MSDQFHVAYSNQVERLYSLLKSQLFLPNQSPFMRRLVIVPSPAMKNWLMIKLANDLGIAAGIDISFLDPSIRSLVEQKRPSLMELTLQLELKMRDIVETYRDLSDDEQTLWKPMVDYAIDGEMVTKRTDRRLIMLADKLAYLFMQYEQFGTVMLTEWLDPKNGGWQGALWRDVVGEVVIPEVLEVKNTVVHLFALSFLSRQQHQLFQQLSEQCSVYYYLLSPCQSFWSDLVSDRQGRGQTRFLEKQGASEGQLMELEDFLYDRNPLLANFGRLGREMATQVEESQVDVYEDYVIPENENSLLHQVQSDLLILRNPDPEDPISIDTTDRSLEVHVASSRMREVEILHDNVLRLIEEGVDPNEMIVMAPDIMDYEPFIRAVFTGRSGQVDCQIMDLHMLSQNVQIQSFVCLLSLPLTRWDSASLIELFDYEPFKKKQKWSHLEVQKICQWIKAADIRWGLDTNHRKEILVEAHGDGGLVDESPGGTWEYGFSRLLLGLVMTVSEDDLDVVDLSTLPLEFVDATDAELFGRLVVLLRQMRHDMRPITQGGTRTLEEWIEYLRDLVDKFLGDTEEITPLFDAFQHVEQLKNEPFSFHSIRHQLQRLISKERVSYRESHVQAVRFCSMLPMRAVPAKVVALLGMQEGAYPRADGHFSFNLLDGSRAADYCPSQTEFDRYLFLEMLLSARRCFMMSYVGYSPSDGKEQPSSLLIAELMAYLDKGYRIGETIPSEVCLVHHPFRPYDRRYFTGDGRIRSYSQTHYREAEAYYTNKKERRHTFIKTFGVGIDQKREELKQIEVRRLVQMARNPIACYFNQTLGMYLDDKREWQLKTEEDFLLDVLDHALLRKQGVAQNYERTVALAAGQGRLPLGPFKVASLDRLRDDVDESQRYLRELGVDPQSVFSLEFSSHVDQPERDVKGGWVCPPLQVGSCEIVGGLSEVSQKGLVVMTKDDKVAALRHWPQFLLLWEACNKYNLPIDPQLVMARGGKVKSPLPQASGTLLESFCDYYLRALQQVSPLLPEWIPLILEGDEEKLRKKMKETLSDRSQYFYNQYMMWVSRGGELPDEREIFRHWRGVAEEVFGVMVKEWYPSRRKVGV